MSDSEEENRRLFLKPDGEPVKFFLHRSLTLGQQNNLEQNISGHGGVICESEDDADTVLVSDEDLHILRHRYDHSRTVYVELPDFVKRCVKRGTYAHDPPLRRSLGGRPVGKSVKSFTPQDDLNLARYIAHRVPYQEKGGRTGNKIYEDLCAREELYEWASNHPWQSWRNRYNKNKDYFDRLIDDILKIYPPHPEGKGEYLHDRRLAGQNRRGAGHREIRRGRENEEGQDGADRQAGNNADVRTPMVGRVREREANERESVEDSARHRDKRRRSVRPFDDAGPSQPRRQAAQTVGSSDRVTEEMLNGPELQRFEDDGNYVDMYDDHEVNAPASTLVAPSNRVKPDTSRNLDGPVEGAPSSSFIASEPRMAARNKERSAAARPGATGRTVLTTSPPKSTQATLVGTQVTRLPPTQIQGREQANREPPADAAAEEIEVGTSARPPARDATRNEATEAPSQRLVPRVRRQMDIDRDRRDVAATQAADAPYRNTRARSRSVEPMPPPPAVRPRAGGRVAMQTVEEDGEENGIASGGAATYDEQQSLDVVEDALRIVQTEGSAQQEQEIIDLEDEGSSGDEEEEEEEEEEDVELLRRGEHLKRSLAAESTPRQSRPSFTASRHEVLTAESHFRPISRRMDTSSESDFPTPGTRAEEARHRREEREKAMPFAPTPGTRAESARAAQQAGARPVQRARKVAGPSFK